MKTSERINHISQPLVSRMLRRPVVLVAGAILAALTPALAQVTGIYNFTATGSPQSPQLVGVIAQGTDGNMYTTSPEYIPSTKTSVVFKFTPSGKMTVIYTFPAGVQSYSGLVLGTNGDFYGTTYNGGTGGKGTVFKITRQGVLTTLYNFLGENDGANPMSPPIEISGVLYGTATAGGMDNDGTVYRLKPSGQLTPLVQFSGATGEDPVAPLVLGNDGRLYGITRASTLANGPCIVFSLATSGTDFTEGSFGEAYSYSEAALVQGTDGNFYGTVYTNIDGSGQVFKVTPSPSYVFTILYSFTGGLDGKNPYAGLLLATDGNFYGVAQGGGADMFGTLYEIESSGVFVTPVPWTFTGGPDGAYPSTPLIQNTNGMIYGTTANGGSIDDYGVIFRFDNHLGPFVSLVSTSGKTGATIGILGQNLTGTTAVSFNGTAATFTVVSGTYMTAQVPSGATTGTVTVVTPSAMLTSNRPFQVTD
jgi:uncharacterized repeat protein (TIGR03803 family)